MKDQIPIDVKEFFPYKNLRPSQAKLINLVNEVAEGGGHLVVEGANGLGKTISILAGVLNSAKRESRTIIYCCRTHRQADRVLEEVHKIREKGCEVSALALRGRNETCSNELVKKYALDAKSALLLCKELKKRKRCDSFEKIQNEAWYISELEHYFLEKPTTGAEFLDICQNEEICAYELAKRLIQRVDIIALSYLYIFDPSIRESFLRYIERPLHDCILIFDEAHNLPQIATEIASDSLSQYSINAVIKESKSFNSKIIEQFGKALNSVLTQNLKNIQKEDDETFIDPSEFLKQLEKKLGLTLDDMFFNRMKKAGEVIQKQLLKMEKHPRSFVNRTAEFMMKWMETSNRNDFVHLLKKYKSNEKVNAQLTISALDPRYCTEPIIKSAFATISASGTLQPINVFIDKIGLSSDSKNAVLPSPYSNDNVCAYICEGVSTALKQRTPETYSKMVDLIYQVCKNTPQNIGVFCASYNVLDGLLTEGLEDVLSKPLLTEKRQMSSHENDKLIQQFKDFASFDGAVLLGVMGGRSAEGADYPGNEMNSVVIVGVPYASPTPMIQAQIKYYDTKFGQGRMYGYNIPAMRRASQAAGRPIRSLTDRGAIIFLDYRFATPYLRGYLPGWVRENTSIIPYEPNLLGDHLKHFFDV
jgi:DNA excision repair protein ERCC-2